MVGVVTNHSKTTANEEISAFCMSPKKKKYYLRYLISF